MTVRIVDESHTESAYHCVEGRRPREYGGGACNVLTRRYDGRVELLFHAAPETAAVLTDEQAREIAAALLEAAHAS